MCFDRAYVSKDIAFIMKTIQWIDTVFSEKKFFSCVLRWNPYHGLLIKALSDDRFHFNKLPMFFVVRPCFEMVCIA